MKKLLLIFLFVLSACTKAPVAADPRPLLDTAFQYVALSEKRDHAILTKLLGFDPRETEWCAGFVNAILHMNGYKGSEQIHEHPLLAKSFTEFGLPIELPMPGDIVVFNRQNGESWQGHVGFYVSTKDDRLLILSGNTNDRVRYEYYDRDLVVAIRRPMILD